MGQQILCTPNKLFHKEAYGGLSVTVAFNCNQYGNFKHIPSYIKATLLLMMKQALRLTVHDAKIFSSLSQDKINGKIFISEA